MARARKGRGKWFAHFNQSMKAEENMHPSASAF
jgi:hypothetical protein